ncbi:hypothetical protein Q7434_06080 [Glaesserella parasuis]|nr:hypothetical protein [Glaesserella parasuis]MDP0009837.1 hypothetical protein [Glaesserella parasuis]
MKAKVKHTALLHNGKRYEVGDDIELTEQEAQGLAYYLELIDSKAEENNVETTKVKDTAKADEATKVQAEATAIADELDAKEAEATEKATKEKAKK